MNYIIFDKNIRSQMKDDGAAFGARAPHLVYRRRSSSASSPDRGRRILSTEKCRSQDKFSVSQSLQIYKENDSKIAKNK